jgi:hypothetical protein
MPDLTPAAELRAAAERLRQAATTATPGPWHVTVCGPNDDDAYVVSPSRPVVIAEEPAGAGGQQDAAFIAAMHPGVGLALADWLDAVSSDIGDHSECLGKARCELASALAVARSINTPTEEQH